MKSKNFEIIKTKYMTPSEKAKEFVEKMEDQIRCSDFHIPEFVTGVPMADGSDRYGEVLEKETNMLAKRCAIIAVDNVYKALGGVWADVVATTNRSCKDTLNHLSYWLQVKEEIEKL